MSRDGRLDPVLSSSKEDALTFSTLLFMKCLLNRYKVSVSRLVEGVNMHSFLPLVGAEARSGFILPSTLAAIGLGEALGQGGGSRAGGGREQWVVGPGAEPPSPGIRGLTLLALAGAVLLLCSMEKWFALGSRGVSFSGPLSCLPSPRLRVSSSAISHVRVLCDTSNPVQGCLPSQISQGTALSPWA